MPNRLTAIGTIIGFISLIIGIFALIIALYAPNLIFHPPASVPSQACTTTDRLAQQNDAVESLMRHAGFGLPQGYDLDRAPASSYFENQDCDKAMAFFSQQLTLLENDLATQVARAVRIREKRCSDKTASEPDDPTTGRLRAYDDAALQIKKYRQTIGEIVECIDGGFERVVP